MALVEEQQQMQLQPDNWPQDFNKFHKYLWCVCVCKVENGGCICQENVVARAAAVVIFVCLAIAAIMTLHRGNCNALFTL